MKKLNKKQKKEKIMKEKIMKCFSAIGIAITLLYVSIIFLLNNFGWMTLTFFFFGVMFCMGYALLRLALKKIYGVGVNA